MTEEIKISESRFIELTKIEEKYYQNFEKYVSNLYTRIVLRNKYSFNDIFRKREVQEKIDEYINRSIKKSGMDYPKIWLNSGGTVMYWRGHGNSKTIYTDKNII